MNRIRGKLAENAPYIVVLGLVTFAWHVTIGDFAYQQLSASAASVEVPTEVGAEDDVVVEPTIEGKSEYKLGEKIVLFAKYAQPADSTVTLSWTMDVQNPEENLERRGEFGEQLYVWPTDPGRYTARLVVSTKIPYLKPGPKFPGDPSDIIQSSFTIAHPAVTKQLLVTGSTPGPGPQPPEPPPVVPDTPTPGTLASLVPVAAHRAALVELFADLADAARAGQFVDNEHFRNTYRDVIAKAKAEGKLPQGLTAIDKPISDAIAAAIGLEPKTPVDGAKLAAILTWVSEQFAK